MGEHKKDAVVSSVVVAEDEGLLKLKNMGPDEWRTAITDLVHDMRPRVFNEDAERMWKDIKDLEGKVEILQKQPVVSLDTASYQDILAIQAESAKL